MPTLRKTPFWHAASALKASVCAAVPFGRAGSPERAVVACRTLDGRRAWAHVTDPDQLAVLVTEEGCGRLGTLRADGEVDLR